jgi:hypothetical protein
MMDALPPPVIEISNPAPAESERSGEIPFVVYSTGYASGDNTPRGSVKTTIRNTWGTAGGSGTYDDPITLAVGHSIINGADIPDYEPGTKFYFPYVRKYFSVQDTCGDGSSPQNGPCHIGYQGHVWLDFYVGEVKGSPAEDCENNITGLHVVIQNPARNYAVVAGPVYASGCKVFSEDVLKQDVTEYKSDRAVK